QIIVVVASGIILAKVGIVTANSQKAISKVNLYFLTPCLLFTNIASGITWERFLAFWPIPMFFIIFSTISWSLARTGSRLLRLTLPETKLATASIMFFNCNSLPLAMIHSLAFSAASKKLMRDENDTSEDIVASVCDNLIRWSYGVKLLSRPEKEESTDITTTYNSISSSPDLECGAGQAAGDSEPRNGLGYRILEHVKSLTTPPLITAILALFVGLIPPLHRLFMDRNSDVYSFVIRPLETCGRAAVPMILLCLGAQVTDFASSKPALPPPSPLESDLVSVSTQNDEDETINEEQPLLAASTSAVTPSGRLLPPSTVQNKQQEQRQQSASEMSEMSSNTSVPFILISRMLLVPLVALPLVLFCPPGLSPHVTSDPAFRLSLVTMISSPTAINLIQICQINGYLEQPMAGVLFWSYCVVGLPSVLSWAVIGLWAASGI
ncbi:hypothetical protein BGZ79_004101, partial [Entomortierella chlamydospora]